MASWCYNKIFIPIGNNFIFESPSVLSIDFCQPSIFGVKTKLWVVVGLLIVENIVECRQQLNSRWIVDFMYYLDGLYARMQEIRMWHGKQDIGDKETNELLDANDTAS